MGFSVEVTLSCFPMALFRAKKFCKEKNRLAVIRNC